LVSHEEASLRDGILHGLSTEVKKWWHAFILIPNLISGRFRPEHEVTVLAAKKMILRTRRPMHVDIDGDIKTKTPVTVTVQEKALCMILPLEAIKAAPGLKTEVISTAESK
jgi:diacylglycerol kinase family enzyme